LTAAPPKSAAENTAAEVTELGQLVCLIAGNPNSVKPKGLSGYDLQKRELSNILVLATHSHDLAINACARAIWLEHGKIETNATSKEVCDVYFKG